MCRITGDWSTGSLDMLLFWQGVKIYTLISHNNEKDSQVRRIHWSPPYSAKRWSMQTSSSGIHRGCLLTHSAHPNTVTNRDSIPFPMFTASCVLCIARAFMFWTCSGTARDARSDCDLGTLEASSMSFSSVLWFASLQRLANGGEYRQGMPLPLEVTLDLKLWMGRWCMSRSTSITARTQGFPGEHGSVTRWCCYC